MKTIFKTANSRNRGIMIPWEEKYTKYEYTKHKYTKYKYTKYEYTKSKYTKYKYTKHLLLNRICQIQISNTNIPNKYTKYYSCPACALRSFVDWAVEEGGAGSFPWVGDAAKSKGL